MTDANPQTEQATPVTPALSPINAIQRAREVADRYKRQQGYLTGLNQRLPIMESALAYHKKMVKESTEEVTRLTKEIEAAKKHIEQLTVWLAKHADMPDDIAQATALAEKIKRLQKEIERRQKEMDRLANGLPE